jgi:GTP-binding protein
MEIVSATFVKSSANLTQCPDADVPEYAFIGRSNVGKSSLINMLTGRLSLAKISQTPGKTQLINHFMINEGKTPWLLADLPGYGYAKVSKKNREVFSLMIRTYLKNRENLMCAFVLLDSRLPAQKIDLEFMEWMGENGIPFVMVFTKVDKLNKTETAENFAAFEAEMLKTWEFLPQQFRTSSTKGKGKEELINFISETNAQW